jgi:hypothetical protein
MNEFMSDALDDLRDDAFDALLVQHGCEVSAFVEATNEVASLDPEIEALASSETTRSVVAAITAELHSRRMWMEQQAFAAAQFMTAFVRSTKAATEIKPYVVAVGKRTKVRNALEHTLHQTGVL